MIQRESEWVVTGEVKGEVDEVTCLLTNDGLELLKPFHIYLRYQPIANFTDQRCNVDHLTAFITLWRR